MWSSIKLTTIPENFIEIAQKIHQHEKFIIQNFVIFSVFWPHTSPVHQWQWNIAWMSRGWFIQVKFHLHWCSMSPLKLPSPTELNTAIALCTMLTVNTKLETAKDYLSQFWIGEQKWKKVESHWHQQYQDKRKCQCCRCGLNGPQNAKTQQLYECEQIYLPQSNLIKQNTTSAQSVLSDN